MCTDRVPPEHIPLINLPNTPKARKSRLLQPQGLEASPSPQHNGEMDREGHCDKTPILHYETQANPPKPVWHHAREINHQCSTVSGP